MGVSFGNFVTVFLSTQWKWNNLVSLRPNYFVYIGYLKRGRVGGLSEPPEPPLDPPLLIDILTESAILLIERNSKGMTVSLLKDNRLTFLLFPFSQESTLMTTWNIQDSLSMYMLVLWYRTWIVLIYVLISAVKMLVVNHLSTVLINCVTWRQSIFYIFHLY